MQYTRKRSTFGWLSPLFLRLSYWVLCHLPESNNQLVIKYHHLDDIYFLHSNETFYLLASLWNPKLIPACDVPLDYLVSLILVLMRWARFNTHKYA